MSETRILQILDKPPGSGGTRYFVEDCRRAWQAAGAVVATWRYGGAESEVPPTVHLPAAFADTSGLATMMRAVRPDVVHLHAGFTTLPPPVIAALADHAPVVGVLHDVSPFCFWGTRLREPDGQFCGRVQTMGCVVEGCYRPPGSGPWPRTIARVLRRLARWSLWRALHALVVPSGYLRNLAVAHGASADRVHIVPHFANLPEPAPHTAPRPPHFLYVGRLVPTKGADCFVEALLRLRPGAWQARIVGDGPEGEVLRARLGAAGLGAQVRFLGEIDRNALGRHYSEARCLVFPSRQPEAFGLVGIEALAQSCPVVGVPAGGASEWLVEGRGSVPVPVDDPAALAAALTEALRNPEGMAVLGAAGRALVAERFTAARHLAAMREVHVGLGIAPSRPEAA
jgi:glycosyltransferase involved in cell wall biosynthesis